MPRVRRIELTTAQASNHLPEEPRIDDGPRLT